MGRGESTQTILPSLEAASEEDVGDVVAPLAVEPVHACEAVAPDPPVPPATLSGLQKGALWLTKHWRVKSWPSVQQESLLQRVTDRHVVTRAHAAAEASLQYQKGRFEALLTYVRDGVNISTA